YDALAWGRHINDHRDAWEVVRRTDHPNVGLILDSFHTLSRKIDVNSIRSIPKEKIFIVQLADAPLIDMDLLYWSRHFRNMPGEGDLPVLEFMKAVAATGYDGYLSLEIFNDQFRGGSPRVIAVDGRRSLVYLDDQVNGAEAGIKSGAPAMPPRGAVERVAFVEFTIDGTEAPQLQALLVCLGFQEIAKHKTKRVSLFRQGEINLVINTEKKGFAGSSNAVHGTSAYAMGLMVDDARAVVERAVALGAERFQQPLDAGEIEMPAVRGIGGGIVYFLDHRSPLDHIWDTEFDQVEGEIARPAGLRTFDHIAQTIKYEELPTWLLFYTSILQTHKTPMVDIIDPAGIVRSQVVENEAGSLRITLNGAENRHTLAGHFIAETLGSGIQHLAFATDDIFATAEALKANGFT
ncbi:MAG: bifunctional sugar phosphate isomerase/epimerase/4-hydroxyphenylpyruvate dioxygenase family protein, partial [Phyllobacterium sp.]